MIQSDSNILGLISQGENDKVEFKTQFVNEQQIGVVLTAFANTNGGILFIGVKDKGEIEGLTDEEANKILERLNRITISLFPYPADNRIIKVHGKNVVISQVDKAPEHLQPITTATGDFYYRQGDKITKNPINESGQKQPDLKTHREIICFVAMSFRIEEEPALVDYFNAMIRAAKRTNLPIKLNRIDLQEGDFEISQQIMTEIDTSDFVLADFTLNPHNVYFEIGYARGAKKRIIQTSRKDTVLQFDVRNWTTLFYRNATELEEKLISKFENAYNEINK